jgi:hypothetical protein
MGNPGVGPGREPEPVEPRPEPVAGGGFEVPRSLSDVIVEVVKAIFKLGRNPDVRKLLKSPWAYTVFGLLVAAWGWFGPHTFPTFAFLKNDNSGVVVIDGIPFRKEYAESVKSAEQHGKAYFIDAVTMIYDIDIPGNLDPQKPTWNISWRNTYTITALRDIGSNETVFQELFSTMASDKTGWAGTEDKGAWPSESPIQSFYVKLEMKKGEKRTFTTGIDLVKDLTKDKNPADYNNRPLGANEDYLSYPNVDDYIGNLLLTVRSRAVTIQPDGDVPAFTSPYKHKDCPQSGQNLTFPVRWEKASSKENGWHTISKEWANVAPCELVGFFYKWENPTAPTGATPPKP